MGKPLKFLLVMAVFVLHESSATHPFYQAFSPLREAFGDRLLEMKPSPDVGSLYSTSQTAENSSVFEGNKGQVTSVPAGILQGFPSASTDLLESSRIAADTEQITSSTNTQLKAERFDPGQAVFNLDTFTFNRNNTKRGDDIFSALADVEVGLPEESETVRDEQVKANTIPNAEVHLKSKDGAAQGTANDFTKKILHVVKNIESVLSTMSFMKNLYYDKKSSMEPPGSASSPSPSSLSNTSNETSSILDMILDVPTLESLQTVGLTARTEREFLDHLTTVLVGAETRSSALTLDPVTVIALLTLAAYLIRAVYEIITVTGRSLDKGLDGHALSDLPDTLAKIHNWMADSNIQVDRDERVTRDVKDNFLGILGTPGDIAAVLKLNRQGDHTGVRQFLCQQLQYRPLRALQFSDMMIGWISSYYGDPTVSQLIDNGLDDGGNICSDNIYHTCSSDTLFDTTRLRSIIYSITEKIFGLVDTYRNWI